MYIKGGAMSRSNIKLTKSGQIYAEEFIETKDDSTSLTYNSQYPFSTDFRVYGELDETSWSGTINLGNHTGQTKSSKDSQHTIICKEFIEGND